MLYRKVENLIESHLKSNSEKILLVDGARQVGKTFIIRRVGQKLFENYIELNMIEDSLSDRLFESTRTVTYSGTSGQSFRKHPDMKPGLSGHLAG